ncbi:MAG: YDG domain-containing protein, partial [Steroidobacteraceae bacterium]
ATANVAGSPYAIIPSAATGGTFNAGNYTIGYVNGVLTVNPAMLTVGLTSTTTKIYDGTTAATLSAGNYTLTGILNGDPVSLNDPANGAYATKNVGTGINVSVAGLQLLGPQAGDYELESTAVSGKIGIITPATLAYVANPAIDSVGTSLPVLAGTVSGFVGGDTLDNSTTGTLAFATTATHASPPGAYAINGSGLVASDYIFVQAPSNATALVLANPTNIGTQPIPVGADPLPIVPPEARNPLDPSGVMQTASANSCRIPSNFDISATLPSAAERIESSAGMGDFAIIYQSDFGNGQESNDKFAGSLSYASSFTAFDSHERPGWCVRRWSRT